MTGATRSRTQPADADDGKFGQGANCSQPFDADGIAGIRFRRRRTNRTDAEIIDGVKMIARRLELFRVSDGQPDDEIRSEQTPRIRRRHVVLAEMHAIGARGEHDIDAIVDDQGDVQRREQLFEPVGLLDEIARCGTGIANLNHCHAARHGLTDRILEIARADRRASGDEIKRKIERNGHRARTISTPATPGNPLNLLRTRTLRVLKKPPPG